MDTRDTNNLAKRQRIENERTGSSSMGWLIGAALAVAIVIGLFASMGTNSNTASNQTNTPVTTSPPMQRTEPTTTGSGMTSPTPAPVTPAPSAR